MNASRALAAEQAIALTAGVARDLIAQGPTRGLPRPRFLMAVFAFYAILGLVAAFGRNASRVAVAFGGVAALTTIVVGPGGAAVAGLFQRLGGLTTPGTGVGPNTEGAAGTAASTPAAGAGGPNVNPVPGVSAAISGGYRSAGQPVNPDTGKPIPLS